MGEGKEMRVESVTVVKPGQLSYKFQNLGFGGNVTIALDPGDKPMDAWNMGKSFLTQRMYVDVKETIKELKEIVRLLA